MFPTGVASEIEIPNINGRNHVAPIADLKNGYSEEETLYRNKLASLYRLVDLYNWSQSIYNHMTVRLPNTESDEILINPFGLFYSEITASSLVKVDLQGKVLDPGSTDFGINQAGYVLHSALHAARPDVQVIVHLHIPSVAAVASMKCGLLPICQESMIVGEVAYHDYQGILVDLAEKESLAKDLGNKNVMLLRNHGFVVCGSSIEHAYILAYHLILACETQVRALSAGGVDNLVIPTAEAARRAHATASGGGGGVNRQADGKVDLKRWGVGELDWEAAMRTLDRMNLQTGHIYKKKM